VAQLGKLLMQSRDSFVVGKELHSIHTLMSQRTDAVAVQHGPNLVESYLFF
jgi:hypothetical protein